MRAYKDKEELKNEIHQSFEKYISEFDTIPEALKDKRVPDVDRTPAENLAYQVECTSLKARNSGVGKLILSGTADQTEINSNGVNKIDATELNKF